MKLTRKELHDLVWNEPMTTVCKRFGITDNGLRKHCKSMNIPTPPNGYWAKLKNGKKVDKVPLPQDYIDKKDNVELSEVDPNEVVVDLTPLVDKQKNIEQKILSGRTDCFVVPEVLYAKDALIIDTKEKFRIENQSNSDNDYLRKNPYKSKIKETLDIYVSINTIDRALSIFSTIINSLRFRGHNIKIDKGQTYAVVNDEEFRISISERRKKNPNSDNSYSYNNTVFCGELRFNMEYRYREKMTYKDTSHTRLEDKIISIIAFLERKSDDIKEYRIEEEKRRIKREEEERKRKEFEARRKTELKEFQSLFTMAERLHKANVIRSYIYTYEEYIHKNNIDNEEASAKIEWAKEKADWLDPFISKEDKYLDHYEKDKIIQPECPKQHSWQDTSYYSESESYNFWAKPWWKKNKK